MTHTGIETEKEAIKLTDLARSLLEFKITLQLTSKLKVIKLSIALMNFDNLLHFDFIRLTRFFALDRIHLLALINEKIQIHSIEKKEVNQETNLKVIIYVKRRTWSKGTVN